MILLGEVSKVNDDRVDNRFYEEVGRFPKLTRMNPLCTCWATSILCPATEPLSGAKLQFERKVKKVNGCVFWFRENHHFFGK